MLGNARTKAEMNGKVDLTMAVPTTVKVKTEMVPTKLKMKSATTMVMMTIVTATVTTKMRIENGDLGVWSNTLSIRKSVVVLTLGYCRIR